MCRFRNTPKRTWWAVQGQLTALARGSPFDEPLRRAVLDRRRTTVLDLADVSLVDAGGLGLLLTTYPAAIEHRIALQLGNVPPQVRHLLEVTKLTTVLPPRFVSSMESSAAQLENTLTAGAPARTVGPTHRRPRLRGLLNYLRAGGVIVGLGG